MAVDSLRAVELVTAAGEVVRASADEHPDLFWAVRGGGGNFGVATWLEYELYPVGPMVTGGLVAHPFAAARDVLRFYRDFTASLPDELTRVRRRSCTRPTARAPSWPAIIVCHAGSLEAGAAAVAPVKRFGSPVMDVIGPMPYTAVNTLFDAGFPRGALNYWKSNFLAALGDAAIDTMIEHFAAVPVADERAPARALPRRGDARGADGHRLSPPERGLQLPGVGEWLDPAATAANVAWARDTYAAMAPHFAAGRYVNYLNADEVGEDSAVSAAFGPNWKRLREVKRRYDPDNVFHLNQNIKP